MSKGWGEKDFPMVLNETLAKAVNQQNLNLYLDTMNHLESMSRDWAGRMRSCSRTALNNYADAAKKAKEGVIDGVRSALSQQGIQMISIPSSTTTKSKVPFTFQSSVFTNEYVSYPVERFNIIMPTPAPAQATSSSTPAPAVTYQTVQNPDGTTSTVAKETPAKATASSTTPLLIGGALLAVKFLI